MDGTVWRWLLYGMILSLLAAGAAMSASRARVAKTVKTASSVASSKDTYALALMHLNGTMVARDEPRAATLMEQAARQGYPPAMYYLGVFYHAGIGVAKDRKKAAYWLRRSAEAKNRDAQYAYGVILLAGDGTAANRQEGVEWIGKAAGQGDLQAKALLRNLVRYPGENGDGAKLVSPGHTTDEHAEPPPPVAVTGGLVLDQGAFSLRFSLPDLEQSPYPRTAEQEGLMDRLRGGNVEIIIPIGK